MNFEIGDEVKTTCKHYGKYLYTFEGKIDDIQERIITVYGRVSNGVGICDNKYLRDFYVNVLELSIGWFEEMCWICGEAKLVHDDERCTFADPGFICEECELAREASEKLIQRHMIG